MRYLLLLGLVAFSAASDLEKDVKELKDVPCVCPLTWKPVCGNDGHTYPNECILKCVKLALKPDLEVAHQGACSHLPQAAQEEEIVGLNLRCGCHYIWKPVCGNDGRTYPNKCELNCFKRALSKYLEIAHQGACKHYLQVAQEEEVEGLKVGCACPYIWKPVCGNDGRTYPNRCNLNCAKRGKPELELAYEGACKDLLQAAQAEEVDWLGWDPCECPRPLYQVCGSDGNTYSNPCMLNCAKHEGNPNLEQVHEGPCDEHDHDFEDPCKCDNTYEPVCGNDGTTYHNFCHLECATFTTSLGVEVAYNGECRAEIENFLQKIQGDPCAYPLDPVCGSDGNTYSNLCRLDYAKFEGNPNLKQVHEGPCGEQDHDFDCPCKCDNKFEPVCGDDGTTYRNLCHLECATTTTSRGVIVEHKGECHAGIQQNQQILKSCICTKIYKPVCGTDGLTYPNLCILKCHVSDNQGLEVKHEGKCHAEIQENQQILKRCMCPAIYKPVCGTDGITYSNLCVLNCHPRVQLAHVGNCNTY